MIQIKNTSVTGYENTIPNYQDADVWRCLIEVDCDVTAPVYWWNDFGTYGRGNVRIPSDAFFHVYGNGFTLEDFSYEKLIDGDDLTGYGAEWLTPLDILKDIIIPTLNESMRLYLKSADTKSKKKYLNQIIKLLPSSYNETRTVKFSYEDLYELYLLCVETDTDEWRGFIEWLRILPYSMLITGT